MKASEQAATAWRRSGTRGFCVALACAGALLPLGPSAAEDGSPIFGVHIPDGYRHWELIAPSHETGEFNELRGILGNPIAVRAYEEGRLPFPDGTILVKLAWKREPSSEFSGAFVPGRPTTVQLMVKDARRYADTGGWGFGRFIAGRAVDRAQHEACFPCHQASVRDHDYVFTRFAP
ncbi:MAG: cytochrome P460 family protein [Proteobacteria bacterium]|nr:cytochrome P460 family protein [Pseudomonadota bacterium]